MLQMDKLAAAHAYAMQAVLKQAESFQPLPRPTNDLTHSIPQMVGNVFGTKPMAATQAGLNLGSKLYKGMQSVAAPKQPAPQPSSPSQTPRGPQPPVASVFPPAV